MHVDARQLENGSTIKGDICIIGAGAAGISIAMEWINSPYKVVLLESGGFEYDDEVQKLYDGRNIGQKYYPLMSTRLHYFGGTTGHWGGLCALLDDFDFQKKNWVESSGWPIDFEDLVPFYKRGYPILDLNERGFDIKYWQHRHPEIIQLPLDKNVLQDKIWQRSSPTRFGLKYKESITHAKNITLYTYANVTEIIASDNISTVKHVTVKNQANKTIQVHAKHFVLACSALQNARILLASNRQAPCGLGNDFDLVGRYFMEHPEIKSGELWLNNPNPLLLYQWNFKMRSELNVSKNKQKELEILNGMVSLWPLKILRKYVPNLLSWQEKDPRQSEDSFLKFASRAVKENIFERHLSSHSYQAFGIYSRTEQAPNPLSRVTLSDDLDSLGVPRINLNWKLSPIDKKTIREIIKLLGQQIGISGLGRVRIYDFLTDEKDDSIPDYISGAWHHMGTTRMSSNPKEGVVDKNCKVHGIDNLFVAGSSCFPTGGAATPTLTVVALSLRLSDHLKELIKST